MTKEHILSSLGWRRAVKQYDPMRRLSEEQLHLILESGRLAPSSGGFEPWKFLVIQDPSLRARIAEEAGNHQPQITTASHLIVITRRIESREAMVDSLIQRTAEQQGVSIEALAQLHEGRIKWMGSLSDEVLAQWTIRQTYIALGMMMSTASLIGVDNSPMEGFSTQVLDTILRLPEQGLSSVTLLALGYRSPQDDWSQRAKVRRLADDVIEYR